MKMKTMNERKIVMTDKSRERNYVDLFSDYGMDERQIAIQNKIIAKCFKLLYYSILVLTAVWLILNIAFQMEISCGVMVISYFTAAIICQSVYAVIASRNGVINLMTATTESGGGTIIIDIIYAAALIINFSTGVFNENTLILIILCVITLIGGVIKAVCAKRNFKALDEQGREDTEE